MSNVATRGDQEVARPLKVLVPLIKEKIEEGKEAGVPHFRQAGELLLEAKEQVARGDWGGWLKRNFTLSPRAAQYYMQLATRMLSEKRSARPFRTLSEATHPDRPVHHQPAWHEPVKRITARVDMDALRAEEESRAKERKLVRELALQLIDIGYKVLATKLHPDKGGSREAMSRLNHVRDLLRNAI